ncbi:type II secretion system protein [Candidatus Saccharibacteria bacterium]|nr:type II secretion system protein [Candidatus Saccharibacteria bacterium]
MNILRKYCWQRDKARGFTIVELLIVIVVIGILAAIALSVFGDSQRRARNLETSELVKVYKKALVAYVTVNGRYPADESSCLGFGYGDYSNDSIPGDCVTWNGDESIVENPLILDPLKQYTGLAKAPTSKYAPRSDGGAMIGATFEYIGGVNLDGQPHPWWITYLLGGQNQKCLTGPVVSLPSWPNFSSTPPASGPTEGHGSMDSSCWIATPDPARL